jgi:hypothetical protein
MTENKPNELIRAAGGLVWREPRIEGNNEPFVPLRSC